MDVLFWMEEVRNARKQRTIRHLRLAVLTVAMLVGVWSLVGPAEAGSAVSWISSTFELDQSPLS